MEKYSQFRDRGTAIAPFFPVPTPPASLVWKPIHLFLFLVRVPAFVFASVFYFCILQWLPVGSLVKKAALWCVIGIPGVWWIDLQVDGVKRGGLHKNDNRLPKPGTIIASSFTSPLDTLYLAAIFDPIFTRSYPTTRLIQRISLFQAILSAFSTPVLAPPKGAKLTSLAALIEENPDCPICVLPECTTTNGRGILPFSPSLLTAPPDVKIYPINLRYTPGDITTPVPGGYLQWVWKLCSKPTHCIRVRIAEWVYNNPTLTTPKKGGKAELTKAAGTGYETNIFDTMDMRNGVRGSNQINGVDAGDDGLSSEEGKVLERVAEDLARLGRVKRVGLGVKEKIEFVRVWGKRKR